MRKTAILTALAVLILLPASSALSVAATSVGIFPSYIYDPVVVYNGLFITNGIYYHNRNNPIWYLGLKQDLGYITCRPAQASFSRTGKWNGHFAPDSSCGDTSEPTEFAIGNWLNFSKARIK